MVLAANVSLPDADAEAGAGNWLAVPIAEMAVDGCFECVIKAASKSTSVSFCFELGTELAGLFFAVILAVGRRASRFTVVGAARDREGGAADLVDLDFFGAGRAGGVADCRACVSEPPDSVWRGESGSEATEVAGIFSPTIVAATATESLADAGEAAMALSS